MVKIFAFVFCLYLCIFKCIFKYFYGNIWHKFSDNIYAFLASSVRQYFMMLSLNFLVLTLILASDFPVSQAMMHMQSFWKASIKLSSRGGCSKLADFCITHIKMHQMWCCGLYTDIYTLVWSVSHQDIVPEVLWFAQMQICKLKLCWHLVFRGRAFLLEPLLPKLYFL